MSKPKQKTHKSSTRSRRSHHALSDTTVRTDADGTHLPHHATKNDDGTYTYRGKVVGGKKQSSTIAANTNTEKKAKKAA